LETESKPFLVQVRLPNPEAARFFRWGVILLLVTGLACLILFFWIAFDAHYFQASLSDAFDAQRQRLASAERTSDPSQPAGAMDGLVGRLEIPRVGLDVMVVQGVDRATLRRSAAWLPETARPGKAGNVAIAAHRDTYFRPLRQVQEGDEVQITTLDARYCYRVEWTTVVAPSDTSVLAPTGKPALTLITCYPFYYVGEAPQRFIVRASQQSAPSGGFGRSAFD
jgi:sortase A